MSTLNLPALSSDTPAKLSERSTRRSVLIYLALMASLVIMKLILEVGSVEVVVPSQELLFAWPMIAFLTVAGSVAVWIGPRAGLPDLWTAAVARRKWLLIAAGIGLALGGVNLAISALTGSARILADAAGVEAINVPFPASIPFYTGGAIVVESLYRLIAITLPLWLIANLILRKRGQAVVFWIVALAVSVLEPIGQMGAVAGHPEVMAVIGAAMYALNVIEIYLFRRNGFLAPVVFRISFYLVWHVIGGLLGL